MICIGLCWFKRSVGVPTSLLERSAKGETAEYFCLSRVVSPGYRRRLLCGDTGSPPFNWEFDSCS